MQEVPEDGKRARREAAEEWSILSGCVDSTGSGVFVATQIIRALRMVSAEPKHTLALDEEDV
jgi:hypothetical protein